MALIIQISDSSPVLDRMKKRDELRASKRVDKFLSALTSNKEKNTFLKIKTKIK